MCVRLLFYNVNIKQVHEKKKEKDFDYNSLLNNVRSALRNGKTFFRELSVTIVPSTVCTCCLIVRIQSLKTEND